MNTQLFNDVFKKHSVLASVVAGGMLVAFCFFFLMPTEHKKAPKATDVKSEMTKEIGISVGDADQNAYMKRLENNYYNFEDRMKEMEDQVKKIQSSAERIENSKEDTDQKITKLDQVFDAKIQDRLNQLKSDLAPDPKNLKENISGQVVELVVADINPKQDEDWVYLPIGSFCKGTLLTGVYAAADANNPLPVLISLDEAFYGPNKSRIPLKGTFVLGKAVGDLLSERALIQIIAISSVLPNGHAFENEQDLGYVTDEMGELGIKGQVVYNTGRQLALSFMGGFVSGGAQAMADGQVTTRRSSNGDTTREITGDPTKNMVFSGLAQSASKLAEYYEKQVQDMVPAVHIKNGAKVYFIVQKGVTITGLTKGSFEHKRFMD